VEKKEQEVIKVAMVEDDLELAEALTEYLKTFHIEVTNFDDPFIALSSLSLTKFDLVILDLTLPGLDGLEVCKEIVKKHDLPIIISSARSDIADKITTLELGADDYLPKPYDPRELEVRIKTILRRYNKIPNIKENAIEPNHTFVLDEQKKEIRKNGNFIKFTKAEFEVMAFFIKRRGFIVDRYDLIEAIEAIGNSDDGGSVAVIINRIRSKIEEDPRHPKYLQTIRGMGYKLVE
jgi:two-component system OmpR family response regulator